MTQSLLELLYGAFDLSEAKHLPVFALFDSEASIEYTHNCIGMIKEKDKERIRQFVDSFLNKNYVPCENSYYVSKDERAKTNFSFEDQFIDGEPVRFPKARSSEEKIPFRNYIKVDIGNGFVFINQFSIPEYKLN